MDLVVRLMLYEPNRPITSVYFPVTGVISTIATMDNGTGVEVATTGNEGMVGLPLFLGTDQTPLKVFAQVPGQCLRLPVEQLRSGRLARCPGDQMHCLFMFRKRTAGCFPIAGGYKRRSDSRESATFSLLGISSGCPVQPKRGNRALTQVRGARTSAAGTRMHIADRSPSDAITAVTSLPFEERLPALHHDEI